MKQSFLPKLSYSNVVASLALFIALGGAAVAAGLPKHSVGPRQLKRGAVTTFALRKNAVKAGKLAPKAVIAGKLGPSSVLPGNLVNGGVNSNKIANGGVRAVNIKNNVVTTNKLNNNAVTNQKLAPEAVAAGNLQANVVGPANMRINSVGTDTLQNGSVTAAKLGNDVAPLVGTLKSGQTLRGVFDVGGGGAETAADEVVNSAVSFQFPLVAKPAVTVLKEGQTSANCAGLSGGNAETPQATAGNLCIYVTKEVNLKEIAANVPLEVDTNTRLGFGLVARAKAGSEAFYGYGQWAVTAP